jgi:hypothetical protein
LSGVRASSFDGSKKMEKALFKDGFAILPQLWSRKEMEGGDAAKELQSGVFGIQQKQLLHRVVEPDVTVLEHHQLLHMPGFRCTDRSTSPEPWWDQSWQVLSLSLCFLHLDIVIEGLALVGSLREQRSSSRGRVRRGLVPSTIRIGLAIHGIALHNSYDECMDMHHFRWLHE